MINQDKPTVANPEHQLSIGGGFFLKIGGLSKLIINPQTSSSFVNSDKVSVGETWGTIASTWASETRTWAECATLFSNTDRVRPVLGASVTTPFHFPALAVTDGSGTVAWSSPMNVITDNGVYASCSAVGSNKTSAYLKATDFGFTIPNGAVIQEIIVKIQRKDFCEDSDDAVGDSGVKIIKGGTLSGATDNAGRWTDSDLEVTYSVDPLWGLTLSAEDINSPLFGCALKVGVPGFCTASVDYMSMAITYAEYPISSITNQSKP